MPAVAHAANASGFVFADDAAWCEHLAAGGVYTDPQIVSVLAARFDSLRAESYRASESAAMIAEGRTAMDGWRKSSLLRWQRRPVVEVTAATGVVVRDTTDRDGATLTFTHQAWTAFTASLR